jgi:hypothetical protein
VHLATIVAVTQSGSKEKSSAANRSRSFALVRSLGAQASCLAG